ETGSSLLPSGAAATASRTLGGLVAGRPASFGRIRPLRDDPLRHVYDSDRRAVPVHLQRTGGEHAGRRVGGVLLRLSRLGGRRPGRRTVCEGRVRRCAPASARPPRALYRAVAAVAASHLVSLARRSTGRPGALALGRRTSGLATRRDRCGTR